MPSIIVTGRLGCGKHPKYEGRRRTRARCQTCQDIWTVVRALRRSARPFDIRYPVISSVNDYGLGRTYRI